MKINHIIHEAGTGLEIDRSIPGRTIARISGDLAYRTGAPTDKKLPDQHDGYTPWSGKVAASTRDDEEDTFDIDYTGDDGELKEFVTPQAEGVRDLGYDAQSLIMKLRRDVEEKRLQPTRDAVLMAARELAGDMEFAPELLVQQVLGSGVAEGTAGLPDPNNFDSDNDYYDARDAYATPQDNDSDYENWAVDDANESKEKIGNMDADAFDAALSRMKKLAGAGPLRTVYDPNKRVYKNVPHAVQPAQQPKKAR